jgi:hypothetical protein
MANTQIQSEQIADDAVTSAKIAANALGINDLSNATVSSSDPALNTNPTGGVGSLWINSTSGEVYICTNATTNENTWTNIGDGSGPIGQYSAEYVTVAGGGGGGYGAFGDAGGGAGGGGYRSSVSGENSGRGSSAESTLTLLTGTVYTITVGAGGSGGFPSTVGGDSSISGSNITTVTSNGGGAGGGSGGATSGSSNEVAGVGTSTSITGSSVTYAAGGHGGNASNGASPVAGGANTGTGGGGNYSSGGYGANGGSGVVILRVPTASYSGTYSGSPTITTSGSNTIIKFTSSGSYTG